MMKRMRKAGFMGLMVIFLSVLTIGGLAGNAAAGTFTLGTITGTGTVTVDGNNNPTAYSFLGAFAFDNVTPVYNGWTLASPQLMGDVGQYKFLANSSGNLPAVDYDRYTQGSHSMGNFQYDLNTTGNGGPHSSLFYGSVLNFAFQGTIPSGTVTGAMQSSDGYIHWYYGFDNYVGPPAGETTLATFGLLNTFNFNGIYNVTGQVGDTVSYNLTGTLTGNPVPLPPSALFLGSGLLGLVGLRWKRRQAS